MSPLPASRRRNSAVQRRDLLVENLALKRHREFVTTLRRSEMFFFFFFFFANARKEFFQRGVMPPVFALPPAIQKMFSKQASACADESALVALEVIDVQYILDFADLFHAVRRPGNDHSPSWIVRIKPERQRGGDRAGRILRIVPPAQRPDPPSSAAPARAVAVFCQHDLLAVDIDTVTQRTATPRRERRACPCS